MPTINIKNQHAVDLIRELAARKKMSLVSAVTLAVQDKLAQEDQAEAKETAPEYRYKCLMAYASEFARRVPTPIHSWQIDEFLYDEQGLPK